MLNRIYYAVIEAKTVYGCEIWGMNNAPTEINKIRNKYCKSILNIPVNASNIAARLEMGFSDIKIKLMESSLKFVLKRATSKNNKFINKYITEQLKHPKSSYFKNIIETLTTIGMGDCLNNTNSQEPNMLIENN